MNLDTVERLVVKAGVDDPDPTLPSVVRLWPGADWMEREVFDMYGITFAGHPDLRRILMPEEFTAFPLRKDYPLRGRGERHNFPRLTRGRVVIDREVPDFDLNSMNQMLIDLKFEISNLVTIPVCPRPSGVL